MPAIIYPDSIFKHGFATAAAWEADDTLLLAGELAFESDTLRAKIGDGVRTWNQLPYLVGSGFRFLFGDITAHTATATRTSKKVVTIPGGTLGPNGALEVLLGARITGGAPTGPWLVEVELGGDVVAAFQSLDAEQLHRRCLVQNIDDAAVQVAQAETTRDLTIDTTTDQDVEVFVTLDAGDTGLTLELFSLEINTR